MMPCRFAQRNARGRLQKCSCQGHALDGQCFIHNEPSVLMSETEARMSDCLSETFARRIVPVVVVRDASRAEGLGEALVAGDLPVAG